MKRISRAFEIFSQLNLSKISTTGTLQWHSKSITNFKLPQNFKVEAKSFIKLSLNCMNPLKSLSHQRRWKLLQFSTHKVLHENILHMKNFTVEEVIKLAHIYESLRETESWGFHEISPPLCGFSKCNKASNYLIWCKTYMHEALNQLYMMNELNDFKLLKTSMQARGCWHFALVSAFLRYWKQSKRKLDTANSGTI